MAASDATSNRARGLGRIQLCFVRSDEWPGFNHHPSRQGKGDGPGDRQSVTLTSCNPSRREGVVAHAGRRAMYSGAAVGDAQPVLVAFE